MNAATRRNPRPEAIAIRPGVMAPPASGKAGPALMAMPSRPARRGLMELDPSALPFDWSRDGVAFLWLLALVLALVLWIVLLGHGAGQS